MGRLSQLIERQAGKHAVTWDFFSRLLARVSDDLEVRSPFLLIRKGAVAFPGV